MDLLLSRTAAPTDYVHLREELETIDAAGAPEHRRWEQALALHASARWRAARGVSYPQGSTISSPEWACAGGQLLSDVVTCLSVLEHTVDPERFLYHLSCLVAPGGLLILTFAYWNRCGADTATNHEKRQRIYCPRLYGQLRQWAQALQLTPFGGVDPMYHGPHVHDYSIASLVLEKRR